MRPLVPDSAPVREKTEALAAVARILVYEKKIEEALEHYEQANAIEADDEVAIEEAGWCCFEVKQWAKAQEWFTKGTVLQKGYDIGHEALVGVGSLAWTTGKIYGSTSCISKSA
jgi:hypothetical protein